MYPDDLISALVTFGAAWAVCAIVAALVADRKGRGVSGMLGFLLYGLLTGPVALIHALIMRPASAPDSGKAAG